MRSGIFTRSRYPLINVLICFTIFNLIIAFVAEGNFLIEPLFVSICLALFVSILFLAMQGWIIKGKGSGVTLNEEVSINIVFAVLLVFALTIFRFMHRDTTALWLLLLFIALLFVGFIIARYSLVSNKRLFLLIATASGLAGFFFRSYQTLITPFAQQSDMLYLITKALDSFLSGQSPYQQYYFDQIAGTSYNLYLTYLPGEWLVYLPMHLLGVDLRWMNIILEASVYVFLAAVIYKYLYGKKPYRAWLSLGMALMFFMNGYFIYRTDTEMPVFCAMIALFFFGLFRNYIYLGFALLGVLLATNPLALLMVPLVTVYFWKSVSAGKAVLGTLITTLVFAAMILPFIIWSYDGFVEGVIKNWANLNDLTYDWAKAIKNINFSVAFFRYQLQDLLKYIQITITASVLVVFAWKRERRLFELFSFMAIIIFLFLNFNVVVWTYLYQPVILLTLLAVILNQIRNERVC